MNNIRKNPLRSTNFTPRAPASLGEDIVNADYKDPKLKRLTTERGRLMAGRITGLNAKQQRKVSLAIKRARYLALLPYLSLEGKMR